MDVEEKYLIAIPAGRWQLSGIRTAKEMGYKVIGIDSDKNADALSECDKTIIVDIKNIAAVLSSIKLTGIKPSGAVSLVSEAGMQAAAAIRSEYGLCGPDIDTTSKLTNKVEQRKAWTVNGVPSPDWRSFCSTEEGLENIKQIGYPCIVKPADSAGSRGVTVVESEDESEAALETALQHSFLNLGIVESFIFGIEYAVETFGDGKCNHVLCVSEKSKVSGTRGTVAQELATPMTEELSRIVGDTALKALSALGYFLGPGHTEVIINESKKPYLVETAGRGGGFMVFDSLVKMVSGYDIVRATVLQIMGAPVPPINKNMKQCAALRFLPSRPGKVTLVSGLNEARLLNGVTAGYLVEPGNIVKQAISDGDRLAYVIAVGDSPVEVRDRAELAIQKIKIEME